MADDEKRPRAGAPAYDRTAQEPWRLAELQRLVADIAARLRKACAHLPDDEFAALVLDIATRHQRFDSMDPAGGPDRIRTP
jgi:hypothetical protein